MAPNVWQQRIRRAEHLAAQHPFAAEILGFYQHVARFQQLLDPRIDPERPNFAESPRVLESFPQFLDVIVEHAPELLAEVARKLRGAPKEAWCDLLNGVWRGTDEPPSHQEEFLALAFLQPYAEYARSNAELQINGYARMLCPFCNRKPAFGVLRPQGDGGRRSLLCGFCLAEWEFRRVVCAGCGEEDPAKLPVYTAEVFPYIRVECCDTCQIYIKSIDLTKNGLAVPLVDELASVPLDLWAQERGYAKLHLNLLGM